jgi:hypothetical protein
MIDQNRSDSLRFSQAKVHGDSSLPVLIHLEGAPECKTSADWTKIERQRTVASVVKVLVFSSQSKVEGD